MSRVLLELLVGALSVVAPGKLAKKLLDRVANWALVAPPAGLTEAERALWADWIKDPTPDAAAWLGALERALSYVSVIAFRDDAPLIIGGWLAFKVASKWEVWGNVIQVPASLANKHVEFTYLIARRRWGSVILTRFLIGTLFNLLTGVVAGLATLFLVRVSGL